MDIEEFLFHKSTEKILAATRTRYTRITVMVDTNSTKSLPASSKTPFMW